MSANPKIFQSVAKQIDFKPSYALLGLSSVTINMLALALAIMTLQVYDRILPNPGSGTLPVIVTGVCLAVFLETILRLSRSYILGWAGASYEHRVSCEAMRHIVYSDLSRLRVSGTGGNLNRMAAISRLKDFHSGYSFVVLLELLFVPVFILVTIYIAGFLAVVPVVVLMFFTITILALGQKFKQKLNAREQMDDIRYDFLISTLENIHTIKSFAQEKLIERKYESLEEPSTLANFEVTEEHAKNFNATTLYSHIMIIAVVAAGAFFVLRGDLTTGGLIATILLSGRMMQPIQKAVSLWVRYQDYQIALERVRTLFETPQYSPLHFETNKSVTPQGALELNDVSFRFERQNDYILKNVNFKAMPGETILLSGAHGAGKTTLLNVISGLYPIHNGEILIDGHNVQHLSTVNHARLIGHIQNEGSIFSGTIRDNLTRFGQISEREVQDVAAMLGVDRDIAALSAGFDTQLKGNGVDGVAPGLKKRIAMVRALAYKPKLILFDNADRGLDRAAYNNIYRLLSKLKGRVTLIIVSDDYNICDLADRFITLKNGRFIESANHSFSENIQPYREKIL